MSVTFSPKQFTGFFLLRHKAFLLQRKSQVTIRIHSAYLPQSSSFAKQILNGTARKDLEIYVHKLRCEVGIIRQVTALETILPYVQTPHLT